MAIGNPVASKLDVSVAFPQEGSQILSGPAREELKQQAHGLVIRALCGSSVTAGHLLPAAIIIGVISIACIWAACGFLSSHDFGHAVQGSVVLGKGGQQSPLAENDPLDPRSRDRFLKEGRRYSTMASQSSRSLFAQGPTTDRILADPTAGTLCITLLAGERIYLGGYGHIAASQGSLQIFGALLQPTDSPMPFFSPKSTSLLYAAPAIGTTSVTLLISALPDGPGVLDEGEPNVKAMFTFPVFKAYYYSITFYIILLEVYGYLYP